MKKYVIVSPSGMPSAAAVSGILAIVEARLLEGHDVEIKNESSPAVVWKDEVAGLDL